MQQELVFHGFYPSSVPHPPHEYVLCSPIPQRTCGGFRRIAFSLLVSESISVHIVLHALRTIELSLVQS